MQEYNLVLEEILQMIQLIQNKLNRCWKQFVLGNDSDGFNLLSEIFIDIENIINLLNNIEVKDQLKIDLNDIEKLFMELENSIELNDYQKIADLIYYPMKLLLKKWRKNINKYIKYEMKIKKTKEIK